MKRQNSQLSSTSRRDNPPDSIRAKSIGCMSGIIHLLSKYQNRHKKSLTFGKSKQEKDIIVVSSPSDQILVSATGISKASPPSPGKRRPRNDNEVKGSEVDFRRRISCDLPSRSPTLSAEIRRSSSVNSPVAFGTSPALVARLMGLDVVPAAPPPAPSETSTEKRRKLLGALEKCDNDLKALKEIIMAFRSSESHQPATTIAGSCLNRDKVRTISGRKYGDYNCCVNVKQPSPASVLDECSRFHLNRINRTSNGRENGQERPQQLKKAAVEEDNSCFNPTKLERIIKFQSTQETAMAMEKKVDDPPLTWRSKAMAESLNEISNEISWGFKHETAKIGMALQQYIYRDLMEEMVSDMMMPFSACFPIDYSLPPFEACRRRLRF